MWFKVARDIIKYYVVQILKMLLSKTNAFLRKHSNIISYNSVFLAHKPSTTGNTLLYRFEHKYITIHVVQRKHFFKLLIVVCRSWKMTIWNMSSIFLVSKGLNRLNTVTVYHINNKQKRSLFAWLQTLLDVFSQHKLFCIGK